MGKIVWTALAALVLVSCGGGGSPGDPVAIAPVATDAKAKVTIADPTLVAQPIVLASASPVGNQVLRSIVATSDGGYSVVWLLGASTLVVQHFDSLGAKDSPETPLAFAVQAPTPAAATEAIETSAVTVLADGSIVVAYQVSRSTDLPNGTVSPHTGVFIQRFGADGAVLLGETEVAFLEQVLNSRSPYITNIQVAALADGGFVVGWAVAHFSVDVGSLKIK